MKRVLVIPVEGPVRVVDVDDPDQGEVDRFRELVGGWFDEVRVSLEDGLALFVDIDGKTKGKPVNQRATMLSGIAQFGDHIVGTAVLFAYEGTNVVDGPNLKSTALAILMEALA